MIGQTTAQCGARSKPVRTKSASGEIKRTAEQNYHDAEDGHGYHWMKPVCMLSLTQRLVVSQRRGSGLHRTSL